MNNRTSSLRASLLTLCLASAFFAATGVASAADASDAVEVENPVDLSPTVPGQNVGPVSTKPINCVAKLNSGVGCSW